MQRLLSILLLGVTVFTIVTAYSRPALAGDPANGAKIFSTKCAVCHRGGGNVVMTNKTLKQDALEKYGMNSLAAIVSQVTDGKNAMPAFKGRLNPAQIEDVAAYVLEQAEKGWS